MTSFLLHAYYFIWSRLYGLHSCLLHNICGCQNEGLHSCNPLLPNQKSCAPGRIFSLIAIWHMNHRKITKAQHACESVALFTSLFTLYHKADTFIKMFTINNTSVVSSTFCKAPFLLKWKNWRRQNEYLSLHSSVFILFASLFLAKRHRHIFFETWYLSSWENHTLIFRWKNNLIMRSTRLSLHGHNDNKCIFTLSMTDDI